MCFSGSVSHLGLVPFNVLITDHPQLLLLSWQPRLVIFVFWFQPELTYHILKLPNTGAHRDHG